MKLLFLDIQTSGISPARHQVVEIGWSIVDEQTLEVVKDCEVHLVQPEMTESIESDLLKSPTGITIEMLQKEGKPLDQIFKTLSKDFEDNNLRQNIKWVGHYLQFEMMFLKQPRMSEWQQLLSVIPRLCLQKRAKELLPNLPSHTLRALAGHAKVPFQDSYKRVEPHIRTSIEILRSFQQIPTKPEARLQQESEAPIQEMPKAPVSKRKFEFPLAAEKRLTLPDQPGVYRMLDSRGRILYVGKATSLRSRVNSYFRGSKKHSRHRELLSQVYDLRVTPLRDPLEAALLEVKEIHHHRPPYNVAMNRNDIPLFRIDRAGHRILVETTPPYLLLRDKDEHRALFGLFEADSLEALEDNLFFEPVGLENLIGGAKLFVESIKLSSRSGTFNFRSVVAFGLNQIRRELCLKETPAGLWGAGLDWKWVSQTSEESLEDEPLDTGSDQSDAEEAEEELIEWTPQLVAERFERHARRLAWASLRTKSLIRLSRTQVSIPLGNDDNWETVHENSTNSIQSSQQFQELSILNSEIKRWILSGRPIRFELPKRNQHLTLVKANSERHFQATLR